MSDSDFELSYLVGGVAGKIASEKVSFGPFEIDPQTLGMFFPPSARISDQPNETGLASTIREMDLASSNNSGVLGLSFSAESAITNGSTPTILSNLFQYLDDSRRFFAFTLGRMNDTTSSLTIGELDNNHVSDPSKLFLSPVTLVGSNVYDYWKLPLRSLTINGTAFPLSPSRIRHAKDAIAIFDTGTTLVLGPTRDVDSFYISLGDSAQRNKGDMWEIRCAKAVMMGMVFGTEDNEKEFILDPSDISWAEGGQKDGWCIGGIQANDDVRFDTSYTKLCY